MHIEAREALGSGVSWSGSAGAGNREGGLAQGRCWAARLVEPGLVPSFSFGTLAGLLHSLDLSFFIFR